MNGTLGSEAAFITGVIEGRADPRATMLRYGLLVSEVEALIAQPGLSPTAKQVLGGMLHLRQLVGLSDAEIECLPEMQALPAQHHDYLRLGVCCNHVFLHALEFDADARKVFADNGVLETQAKDLDYAKLSFGQPHNTVHSWALVEGGAVKPSDILSPHVRHAKHLLIYDPYFGNLALQMAEELLAAIAISGPLRAKMTILIGAGEGGLSEADIAKELHGYFSDGTSLEISKCRRVPGTRSHLHDRYLQVDQSHTFVFSAGVGCFYASQGKNRGSNVFLHDLYISYAEARLVRNDDGAVVVIRY